jgi:hypothetical protein
MLPFQPGKASPRMNELLWLYELVAEYKPDVILEGGAGVTSAVMKLASPKSMITSVDWAPKDSPWGKQLEVLAGLGVRIVPAYRPSLCQPLADMFFLDSSAGFYDDGGLGHHLRGQALLAGLPNCRAYALVVFHDARRRICKDVRAILSGVSKPHSQLRGMEARMLTLRWDLESGKRR